MVLIPTSALPVEQRVWADMGNLGSLGEPGALGMVLKLAQPLASPQRVTPISGARNKAYPVPTAFLRLTPLRMYLFVRNDHASLPAYLRSF